MKKINKKSTTKKTASKKTPTNVSDLILKFATKTGTTKEFSSVQLRAFVSKNTDTAPSTTDRVLRSLRSNGRLNYTVTDRSKGRYRFTEISA